MKFLTAVTIVLLTSGAAFAQTSDRPGGIFKDLQDSAPSRPVAPAGPAAVAQNTMPTSAQCAAGYQQGMSWTREEFVKACAKPNAGK